MDIVAEDDLRLLGKGPRKLLPPVLLPTTASNISVSCLRQSKVGLFPSKCLVFISSPFFSDPFSLREELKKKEYMSHVYIKCPLLDFTGVIDFPVMYLVIWYLGVLCSVMSTSLRPFRLLLTRFLCPWDSPSKNTGAGYHDLHQGIFLTQ